MVRSTPPPDPGCLGSPQQTGRGPGSHEYLEEGFTSGIFAYVWITSSKWMSNE